MPVLILSKDSANKKTKLENNSYSYETIAWNKWDNSQYLEKADNLIDPTLPECDTQAVSISAIHLPIQADWLLEAAIAQGFSHCLPILATRFKALQTPNIYFQWLQLRGPDTCITCK